MKQALGIALFVAAWLPSCVSPAPRSKAAAVPAPVTPESPPPVAAAPAAPWGVAYQRECRGSITPPVIAANGETFTLCSQHYSADGLFLGRVEIGAFALLGSDRLLRGSYSGRGLVLGPLDSEDGAVATERGFIERAVVNATSTRVVTVVREAPGSATVEVRELPSLKRVDSAAVHLHGVVSVGLLADGSAMVASDDGCVIFDKQCGRDKCASTTCTGRSVKRLSGGALMPMGAFDGVESFTTSADGTKAVVNRAGGARTLVSLPGGTVELALPNANGSAVVGLDRSASRIAFQDGGDLVVGALEFGSLKELHREPSATESEDLVFSPDGRTLYAGNARRVVVLRENEPAHRPLTAEYEPKLPADFQPSRIEVEEGIKLERVIANGEMVSETALSPSTIARYRSHEVEVNVEADDPRELGRATGDLARWTERALNRDALTRDHVSSLRAWQGASGRSLEYAHFIREGCDPQDVYVRLEERAGTLYVVRVSVPPGWSKQKVAPILEAFFDGPLGRPEEKRVFAKAPSPMTGPC